MNDQTAAAADQPAHTVKSGFSFIPPVLAGLTLALASVVIAPHLLTTFRYDGVLIFGAGAAAAVLVIRLLVQREKRQTLQRTVSQIVGEDSSAEVAIARILEALCVSHGWDVAMEWKVNADESQLEFRSAWGVPGQRTQALIQESMGLRLAPGSDLPGQGWVNDRSIWVVNLDSIPPTPHTQSAQRYGMVSGWAVPVRVGNKVVAVLEFYCHSGLREDRAALAAVETAAASLGQMRARSKEQVRAEELYRQQEILLDSVADGICGIDQNGLVSFANPAAARLLATSASSLTGTPVHKLLHGSAPSTGQCGPDCPLRRFDGSQMAGAGEETIYRSDGASFPAEYALTPIFKQDRFSGAVLSFRDISQRYALDRLKDEFISTVSHELRTPLTSIRGALGLLSSGTLGQINDRAANLLRIALSNSDRLVRLINDILDLERIQSGREPLAFVQVQLADIVQQAIDGMAPVAEAADVHLDHDTTQVEIAADADRLLQVLTNLLSNAVKFSPPGSTIFVVLRPGVTGVTLSVIDHGRGIPADKLDTVFGRFQQVDASDARQKGGSGLGLAICRTIVLQHSGRIWAERNQDRGSTFRVFLPYRPVPSASLDAPAKGYDHEPRHGTILLSADDSPARLQVATQLARHGYQIVQSSSVEQTLAAAREGLQAILLDTALEGLNGWEIFPRLRDLSPAVDTPVVLLSVENSQNPSGSPVGVEGLSAKPLDEEARLDELARALRGSADLARVLVIEDDVDLARLIANIFSPDSFNVKLAFSLQQALDVCFAFEPHLLVLDIGLPDGDGFNVVDWLRQNETLARLTLVVYSGRELSPAERAQLALGPTHFLTTASIKPQQLDALVMTMLRDSRQMEDALPPEPAVRNIRSD
jgi:PAS domain S-box-containing protein